MATDSKKPRSRKKAATSKRPARGEKPAAGADDEASAEEAADAGARAPSRAKGRHADGATAPSRSRATKASGSPGESEADPLGEAVMEKLGVGASDGDWSDEQLAALVGEEALAADDEDADEALEETALPALPRGPVFTGPVPLETPAERKLAMEQAAARLGIDALYPEQKEVIDAVLHEEDVLMILPTGFGKSACYQIPSMILPKPVLVISPLLALMRDQYEKLKSLDVPCVRLDGTVRGKARKTALERIRRRERMLVMTTPETLAATDAAEALAESGVSLAAVDEAHCISEWGYDFRPAYLQIGERLRSLGNPPVLALTATATEKVRLAIQRFVGMEDPRVVASSPHRSNLAFDVLHCSGGGRLRALVRLALRVRRPGIIYCSTTREVDEIYAVLQRFGVPSHRYHGKMNASERAKSQDGFMQRGRRTVMVATNAFGLGIDKPDIRYVMHYQAPASLEQYVQEAGRAGRDGRRANCIMLFSSEDRSIHEALLSRSRVRPEQLYRLGSALAAWANEEKVPSMQALALSAELGTRTTGALLALLEEATLVRWDQTAVFVTVAADEIEPRARKLAGQFETLRTQDAQRLDAVAEYALDAECRATFLRDYFGEGESEACGICDRCRGQADRPSSFWEPLAPPKGSGRGRRSRRGRAQADSEKDSGRGRRRRGASGGRRRGRGRGRGNSGGKRDEGSRSAAESSNGSKPREEPGSGRRRGRRRGSRGRRGRRGGEPGRRPTDPPSAPGPTEGGG